MFKYRQDKNNVSDKQVIKSLPHNRKEVFFDLLSHRKMTLFAMSCFTFMFFIPLAVDLFIFNYWEAIAIAAEKNEYLFSLIFYSMLILIPCMVIGFIGFAGAFYTAKRLVWQEDISLGVDFFTGIKENWKRALLNGFLFGVIVFGFVVGGSFLLIYVPVTPIWSGIGIGALILVLITFGIVIALNFTQDVYYENGPFVTLKNSFCFLGLLNWKVLVLFLLTTGGAVTLCCFNYITLLIGLFLFAIFNSVVVILYTLLSHFAFDKYINKEHYPEMVGRGLYKIEKEDKEA